MRSQAQRAAVKKAQDAAMAAGNPGLKKARMVNIASGYEAQREGVKKAQKANITHGLSKHPLYLCWFNMIARCSENAPDRFRRRYFERGIRVCERWQGPDGLANFISDMGQKPPGLTLDRINNDGGYTPENCRWATWKQQANNKVTTVPKRRVELMDGKMFFTGANALKDLKAMHKHWDAVGMTLTKLEAQGEFSLGKHGRFSIPDWTEVQDWGRTRIKVTGMAGLPIHCVDTSTLRATVAYPEVDGANPH